MPEMENIHKNIIDFFKEGKIKKRNEKTLEEVLRYYNIDYNNVDERDLKFFSEILWKLKYSEEYLLLPYDFFPRVSAREKRKRIVELKLNREDTKSKKIAIEKEITPFKLIKDAINKIREEYKEKRFPYSFKGISWRYGNTNKLFYTTDLIEGYYLYFFGRNLIKCKEYFDKESIAERCQDFKRLSEEYNINRLKKDIEEIGGIISGKVMSRTKEDFHNVHLWHIPLIDKKNRGYGVWLDLEKMCSCDLERWEETRYVGPKKQEIFCAHSIALYAYAYFKDQRYQQKIFLIPFPLPSKKLRDIYKCIRKNCFIEKEENGKIIKRPLNKIEIEIMLNRAIILGFSDLF